MPTRNRRPFVGQAIHYFLQQDYAARELVIVDDGDDCIADLVPRDARIRYLRLDERTSVGAKRNLACHVARGELVAHWDDDDWMSPRRLSTQIEALLRTGADACGARELLYYHVVAGQAWLYQWPNLARDWLAGGTLVYWRSLWRAAPFADIDVGEDTAFLWALGSAQLAAIEDRSLYIGIIHPGNTSTKHLDDPHWERRPLDDVAALLEPERPFYAALREGRERAGRGAPPVNLSRHRVPATSVTVASHFMVFDGYGSMAEYLVLGLRRAGLDVHVQPYQVHREGLSRELLETIEASRPDPCAPVVFFNPPSVALDRFRGASDLFINTMWESDRLPDAWPAYLNRARAVIVPTRWMAGVCRACGVTVPIEVVPEGVDPAVYHFEDRSARDGLTTLIVGTHVARKHVAEGVAAWKRAFADDPDARLLVKAHFQYRPFLADDPRITMADLNQTTRGIAHWYREADVLLALGNEGFGLPLVEAMATGLPVIALDSEGQGDVCADAPECLLPVKPVAWQSHDQPPYGVVGRSGVPGVEDVARRLRWVAEHRRDAAQMGRAASVWALAHRNIWSKGPAVADVVENYMTAPNRLRRSVPARQQLVATG